MKLAVRENDGKVLRTVGDSVLASFVTSNAAFMGGRSIQQAHLGMPVAIHRLDWREQEQAATRVSKHGIRGESAS